MSDADISYSVTCVWEAGAILGEGPVWDDRDDSVYWVDIKAPSIHRYDPETHDRSSWPVHEMIGCLIPDGPTGQFIGAMQSGFFRILLGEPGRVKMCELVASPETNLPSNRFNDGKRAPDGSIWAGSMDNEENEVSGSWWRLDQDGSVRCIDTGYKVTNGPAFDPDRQRVFLTDSARQMVYVADCVDGGKAIAHKTVFLTFTPEQGYPDGMTIDQNGDLWIAFWDGGCVRRFSPAGELISTVKLDDLRPTSLAIDPKGKSLYVTSAKSKTGDGRLLMIKLSKA